MTKTELCDYIAHQRMGALGTVSPEGAPQSALIGIAVTPALELIFDTLRSSRKYRNLAANAACSLSIGWTGESTVQYEGEARELSAGELSEYQKIYFENFPDGPDRLSWAGITYFAVKPKWIRYSDFAQNPPLIEEFTFPIA